MHGQVTCLSHYCTRKVCLHSADIYYSNGYAYILTGLWEREPSLNYALPKKNFWYVAFIEYRLAHPRGPKTQELLTNAVSVSCEVKLILMATFQAVHSGRSASNMLIGCGFPWPLLVGSLFSFKSKAWWNIENIFAWSLESAMYHGFVISAPGGSRGGVLGHPSSLNRD